jgi:hypothetical protein
MVAPRPEKLTLRGRIKVEKFLEGQDTPYEVLECENMFLTAGINEIWKLATGQDSNVYDNTHAQIGVGEAATPAAGQTDLQASTNKTYKAMNANYPNVPSGGVITFQATFGTGDANYVWNEFVIKHSSSGICLNRSTNGGNGFGTKSSGSSWVVTATLTIS